MPRLSAPEIPGLFARHNVQLAAYTSWGVGGIAETLFTPSGLPELAAAVRWAHGGAGDFYVLGGGSNVLISDGIIDTPVIMTAGLSGISWKVAGDEVFLDCLAGTRLKSVLSLSVKNGWSGLECAAGIPGTVGGGVAGNAGTSSEFIGRAVERIITVEEDGTAVEWYGRDIDWAYRRCPLFDDGRKVAYKITFRLRVSRKNDVMAAIRLAMKGRKCQPALSRTAGCVFKNPSGDSAGRLLDVSGCKGMTVGGARISAEHANFIENRGEGTAEDILTLAGLCRKRVHETFGMTLDFEIKTLGILGGVTGASG